LDGTLEAPRIELVEPEPEPKTRLGARQALQLIARACVQQIQDQEPRLRRSRSPEALHQIRVALRRWRTALAVFGGGSVQERTRATLKWLARELNEARDLDVFAEAFEPHRSGGEGTSELWAALEQARAEAYARAEEALQSDRLRRLLWRTAHTGGEARSRSGEDPDAREVAAGALETRWRQLVRRGRKLKRMKAEDRHRLRILAKKVRYTAELCGELFDHPRRQARMAAALKRVQDTLGVLNDLEVGEAVALRLALKAGSPQAAFAAGVVAGTRASEQEAKVLKTARRAYEDFAAVPRFWPDAAA
jgi:CHAD domain-containing protein